MEPSLTLFRPFCMLQIYVQSLHSVRAEWRALQETLDHSCIPLLLASFTIIPMYFSFSLNGLST